MTSRAGVLLKVKELTLPAVQYKTLSLLVKESADGRWLIHEAIGESRP